MKSILGPTERSSEARNRWPEANRALWRLTLLPLIDRVVAALNGWLAPRFGPDLRLEADKDAIPALAAEREAVWTRIGQAHFLTPNEKRAELGFAPVDGGDELVTPVPLGLGGLPGGPPGNFKSGRAAEAHTALPLETKDRAAALARFQELSRGLEKAKSEDKTHKVWRIVKDGNTREAHRVMEGVTVPIDEDFTVAGERLRLPSDVAQGSPGNTFNCRCFVEFVTRDGEGADTATVRPPVVNLWSDRRKSIVEDTPAVFEIAESPDADGSEPLHARHSQSQVEEFDEIIIEEARRQQVDPDLVRAIMHVETTQGWYDAFFPFNRTLLPMNIHSGFWKDLGWTREQLKRPRTNIRAGVTLLKRIRDRIENPTVEKIATIYNSLGRERVSDYGARVGVIFNGRLWEGETN